MPWRPGPTPAVVQRPMTMDSRPRSWPLLVCGVALATVMALAALVEAQVPAGAMRSYDDVRDEVMASGLAMTREWIFSAAPIEQSPDIDYRGESRAKLVALRKAVGASIVVSGESAGFDARLWERLRRAYVRGVDRTATISGSHVVEVTTGVDPMVVVGVPRREIPLTTISETELLQELFSRARRSARPSLVALLMEVPADVSASISDDEGRLPVARAFGASIASLMAGECVGVPLRQYRSVDELRDVSATEFNGLEILGLLGLWPYHPVATAFAADTLEKAGYSGLAARLSSGARLYKTRRVALDDELQRSLSAAVARTSIPADSVLAGVPAIRAILDYHGAMPVCEVSSAETDMIARGDHEFYTEGPGHLVRALAYYREAWDEGSVSAHLCNMTARTVLLRGNPALAAVILRQALWIEPQHAYAGANLVVALRALGAEEVAQTLATAVLANPDLSPWGRSELERLGYRP